MSKRRQQQPESQHQSTATQQAEGPTTQDAGVAQAEQVGNAATQDEMQGEEQGQAEAEGALDWVVDKGKEAVDGVMDAVEDWGLEQLDCVDAILHYVDVIGIDAALPLLAQVAGDLLKDAVVEWAQDAASRDTLWTVLDWLKDFAPDCVPKARLAVLVAEALGRGAFWFLDQLAAMEISDIRDLATYLQGATLEELLSRSDDLAFTLMEAAWPTGVGISLEAGSEAAAAVIAMGATYEGTLRHTGGGALKGTLRIAGKLGLGGAVGGGKKGDAEAQAKLECGVDGAVEVGLEASDLGSWQGLQVMASVLTGLHPIQPLLMGWCKDGPTLELVKSVALSGEVNAVGAGELSVDGLGGVAAKVGAKLGALSVELSDIEAEGVRLQSATLTAEVSVGAFLDLGGTTLQVGVGPDMTLGLPVPALEPELEGAYGARVSWDLQVQGDGVVVSEPVFEEFLKANAGGVEGEVGIERDMPDVSGGPMTLEEKLASIRALNLSFTVPVTDALAQELLGRSLLYELTEECGLDVQGTIDIRSRLDADTVQFIAETVANAGAAAQDPLAALDAWLSDPLGPSLGEASTLMCMELAQSADLEVTLNAGIEITEEMGLEVAAGLKFGGSLELGMSLDYEADLVEQQGAPTMTDYGELIERATAEAEALAAK